MTSPLAIPDFVLSGFNHRRTQPRLPPGYDWPTQIKKYCPHHLHAILKSPQHRSKFGYVFCHRGLYDRAMKVPENSDLAIKHGIEMGLVLHEVDVRIGDDHADIYLAHDEAAIRVTSKNRRFTSLNLSEILNTALVSRRVDLGKGDFASSYQNTGENVPHLEDLLHLNSDFRCLQLDLRGEDLPRALARFQTRPIHSRHLLLKGYNFEFASRQELEAATMAEAARTTARRPPFAWLASPLGPHIMMVFYSKPIVALALKARGIDPDRATLADRLSLDYRHIHDVVTRQVMSYVGVHNLDFIPEIVHNGLGLGYNIQTGKAFNPMDGTAITDLEVIFDSRVDRAMIDVSLELRRAHPELNFSSCTRLCDVRTIKGDMVADMKTGRLRPVPHGQKGIATKLRGIHGGLFPQSDLVVADDPFAEIAARTWIDEYAKLDRSQLLRIPYSQWLAQAGPQVVAAVNSLNGPFLPNTYEGPLDDNWNIILNGGIANETQPPNPAPATGSSSTRLSSLIPSFHWRRD